MIEIPITNQPNQSFQVTIPQGDTNITLGFYFWWNRISKYWQMTLTDAISNQELIAGLPLIATFPIQNLLAQWAHLGIGQAYIVPLNTSLKSDPGVNDWGTNFALLWGP